MPAAAAMGVLAIQSLKRSHAAGRRAAAAIRISSCLGIRASREGGPKTAAGEEGL